MNSHALKAGASVLALVVASPALAMQTDDQTADVITVTGQKREAGLQDTSAAVSVLAGDDLQSQGIERLDDLQNATPGLSITDSGLTQSVNIRGIGLASGSPNVSNGVATYYDGVFQPPIVSTNSFYDIGSVEVFRGPQGTFVGSNSTGGAIFINSREPELDGMGGYVQGEIGNYNRRGLEGAVNIPLSDTLAVRAAGIFRERDSYYSNSAGLTEPAALDEYGVRVGLLWEPTANFSALLRAEVADKETGGYAYRPILGTRYEGFRTSDIRTLNYDTDTRNDERNEQYTGRFEYVTDGGTTFRGIAGYQNKSISNLYDMDATNSTTLPSSVADQFVREEVYTAEGNIISDESQPVRWILGGYYQRNEILVDITNDPAAFAIDIDIANEKVTTGLFGQVSFDLNDQFSVDVGARYSTYDIDAVGAVRLVIPNIVVADPGGIYDDDQFTGQVTLNYRPNEDHLFFAFVAKGYKSGGFSSPTASFDPETVMDYEFGWRGTFAGGAVTTQLGAFYYDYSGFQLDALEAATGRTSVINIADAEVMGVEGQIQYREGGFDLSAGFAYTDSSLSGTNFVDSRAFAFANPGVSNVPQCAPGQTTGCADYTPFTGNTAGGPNLFSPQWTLNASLAYEFEVGSAFVTPRLTYTYIDERYAYLAYDPVRDRLPSYALVNAAVTAELGDFEIEFWATNLFDEEYSTGQTGNNEFYGAPAEYGLRTRVSF
ncbi:TonB-dependent receptor [Maricaulis parjimensis]|uniref:TonB-dependent receptor n=1 Tax=Maricaulis parjimensis TaxID=144023 RepID=UPI001939C405|nr:TonB-dependent receptor [Maricaulis parjimensis]